MSNAPTSTPVTSEFPSNRPNTMAEFPCLDCIVEMRRDFIKRRELSDGTCPHNQKIPDLLDMAKMYWKILAQSYQKIESEWAVDALRKCASAWESVVKATEGPSSDSTDAALLALVELYSATRDFCELLEANPAADYPREEDRGSLTRPKTDGVDPKELSLQNFEFPYVDGGYVAHGYDNEMRNHNEPGSVQSFDEGPKEGLEEGLVRDVIQQYLNGMDYSVVGRLRNVGTDQMYH